MAVSFLFRITVSLGQVNQKHTKTWLYSELFLFDLEEDREWTQLNRGKSIYICSQQCLFLIVNSSVILSDTLVKRKITNISKILEELSLSNDIQQVSSGI